MVHGLATQVDKTKDEVKSFRDLEVYKMLCDLHLEVSEATHRFPIFEKYELGSQVRRSSNSIPANLAEGSSSRHINVFIEGISRALGELRETLHHLHIAYRKKYLSEEMYKNLSERYERCGRMLKGLERSLAAKRDDTKSSPQIRAGGRATP